MTETAKETTQVEDTTEKEAPVVQESTVITTETGTTASTATTTTQNVAPKPVQKPAVQVSGKTAGMTFEQRMTDLKVSGTTNQKIIVTELDQYVERMRPGRPINGEQGAAYQYSFWLTLQKIISRMPREEFKSLWSLVLAYFHHHAAGVFHERYVYRFAEYWTQSQKHLTDYQRILNLIKLTADPTTLSKNIKQVDISRTLAGFDEEARQRLAGYYQL